jgi:hypothetical protein
VAVSVVEKVTVVWEVVVSVMVAVSVVVVVSVVVDKASCRGRFFGIKARGVACRWAAEEARPGTDPSEIASEETTRSQTSMVERIPPSTFDPLCLKWEHPKSGRIIYSLG